MKKFISKIPERFHKMVSTAEPSAADISAAQKELNISIPSYITGMASMSDNKKKEISNRYILNSVRHMIEDEKKEAENAPKDKLLDKLTKKKTALRAVVESAAAGEITPEEEKFLLEALMD